MEKKIIYILLFITSILLIGLVSLIIVNATVLNQKFILKNLEKNNYYDNIYDIINEDFKKYTLQSGFGDKIVDDIVNIDIIKQDVKGIVNSIYTGEGYLIQTNLVKQNLEKNIDTVVKENKYIITEQGNKNIEVFKAAIINSYEDNIVYLNSIVEAVTSMLNKIKTIIIYIYIIIILMIILLSVIITRLNKNAKIKCCQIIFLTTGLFFITICLFIKFKVDFENILFFNKAISSVFVQILNNILSNIKIAGIIFCILAIITVFL